MIIRTIIRGNADGTNGTNFRNRRKSPTIVPIAMINMMNTNLAIIMGRQARYQPSKRR